jgi:cell division inhibitor SepF
MGGNYFGRTNTMEWLNRIKSAFTGDEVEYEEEAGYEEEGYDEEEEFGSGRLRNLANDRPAYTPTYRTSSSYANPYMRGGRRVGAPSQQSFNVNTNVNMQVIVTAPKTLEEAGDVCENLKDKKTIIVNLEGIEKGAAQRITDFFCGACYALDGSIQPVSSRIFIIGPYDVNISGQFKEELEANGIKLPSSSMWRA